MRVHRGLLGWGVFFIVLGAVPLLVQAGVVAESSLARAWQLWPLLLIGAGLGLILARTRAALVGGLVVAVTLGVMAGSLVATGIQGGGIAIPACAGRGEGTPFAEQRGAFGSDARVEVDLDCGSVDISASDGDGWSVRGESPRGVVPEIESDQGSLVLRSPVRGGVRVGFGAPDGTSLVVEVPRSARTSLDLSVNAGSGEVALDGMRLDDVTVDVNAGSTRVDLSRAVEATRFVGTVSAGSLSVQLPALAMDARLDANAGSLEVCVPRDVDLRVTLTDNALGSNNFDQAGLVRDGDTWRTSDPAPGAPVIELDASANLGSIALNPEDGCE